MADTIANAKRCRGTVHAQLTRIEKDVGKLEEEVGLAPLDRRKIRCLMELAKDHERDFEQRPVEVLDIIKKEDIYTLYRIGRNHL